MRRRVTRRLIVTHAAWHARTMGLESIFKTGKILRSLEKSGEMVSLAVANFDISLVLNFQIDSRLAPFGDDFLFPLKFDIVDPY